MRDLYIMMSILSTVPFIFIQPHLGILVWCYISYMNPHRLSWGFAFDFQYAMVIGLTTLLAWFVSKEPKRLQINAVSWFLLAFVFWMTFANLFAEAGLLAYEKWERSFKILLMTVVAMILMQKRERVHALVWVIVISLGFFGLKGGIFTILGEGQGSVSGPTRSFIGDNNALAMALVMMVPLARYLQLQSKYLLVRWGMLVLIVATMFSIIGSHSRGAFLGVSVMLIFLLWKSRQRFVLGVLVVLLVLTSVAFVPEKWVERMETIQNYEQDNSAMGRITIWTFATKVALDHPFVGGGFGVAFIPGMYRKYMPDVSHETKNFHSVYFEILGELGFVGLFFYMGVFIAAWRSGSWVIANCRNRPDLTWAEDLSRMIQVSLVGFASAGAFQNLAFFDLYFHLIAIIFVTRIIVASSLEEEAAENKVSQPNVAGLALPRHGHAPGPNKQNLQIRGKFPHP